MLGSETSQFLIDNLKPSAIFSGDDHDYCEYQHPEGVKEVTLKSFSMAMGIRRPGFSLLSLLPPGTKSAGGIGQLPPPSHADTLCLLPDQTAVYTRHYLPLILGSMLILFWLNLKLAMSRNGGRGFGSNYYNDPGDDLPNSATMGTFGQYLSPFAGNKSESMINVRKDREKALPLTLPSRKSSSNLQTNHAFSMSDSSNPPSRPISRTPSLTTVRRITSSRSAPPTPGASPGGSYANPSMSMADDSEKGGVHGSGEGGNEGSLYMTTPGVRSRTQPYGSLLSVNTELRPEGMAGMEESASSYFDTPDSAVPFTPTMPGGGKRPSANRRISNRPSDWLSAAKAKDVTVVELLLDTGPGGLKKWFGRDQLFILGGWLGGRQGVLAKTSRDVMKLAGPTFLVWIVINAIYFF